MRPMDKLTIQDVDVDGKTVLVRVDFNVTFEPGTTRIADDSRISASLPTLRYLLDHGCKLVVCSHLGRPNGKVVEELRMTPVSDRLSMLIDAPVRQLDQVVGNDVSQAVGDASSGDVVVLENLRFEPREEKNDPDFARELASLADIYVNDAFGAAHRAHSSTAGVADHLPAVAGMLMAREISMLGPALKSPERPFVAILGGAKVSDKVTVLNSLASKVDKLLIGGGMGANFLKAKGLDVGSSSVEEGGIAAAKELMDKIDGMPAELLLPQDVMVAEGFSADAGYQIVDAERIPAGWMVMDVGPETIATYQNALKPAKTVVWNGPLGVFEWAPFARGTTRIAQTLATLSNATTIIGGGSTAEAVIELGLAGSMTHVSTGGGASLEFLEGKELPGVAALMDRKGA